MPINWMSLHRYSVLPTTEDGETSPRTNVAFACWLKSKRIRTTIAFAFLSAVVVVSIRSFGLLSNFQDVVQHHQDESKPQDEPEPHAPSRDSSVQWSDFAYVQYVTNSNYLCNSVMIFEALHRLGVKADRLMMYPDEWDVPTDDGSTANPEGKLLAQARDLYGAKLAPIKVQSFARGDTTWRESFTKLLAFNQTQYKRVISLDSDSTVRQSMDELFLLPPSPVAMPRAYWIDQPFLSTQLIVIEPSEREWAKVEDFMRNREDGGFDMDILNTLYKDTCTVIPHRKYDLVTGEFRADKHEKYLGTNEEWDGQKILDEAKFVHFSDWPRPKPWVKTSDSTIQSVQPKCKDIEEGQDCSDRELWLGIYQEFADRRERVCGRRYDYQQERRSIEERRATPSHYKLVFR